MLSSLSLRRPLAPSWGALFCGLIALACREAPPPVSGSDSLSVAAPIVVDSASGQTPGQAADHLDSLRAEVARLVAAVAALEPGSLSVAGDTATAASRARETAQDVRHFGLRVVWTAILLAAAYLVVRLMAWLLEAFSERSATRRLFFKRLIPITRLLVWTFTVYYVVANVFDVDRTGLLAATAALGVGVGFAAQGVLKNIFGGLIIILDQPFQVGDKINVGGTYGEVTSIGLRATRIVTADDNLVSVPNAQVVEGQVANANAGKLDCQVVVDLYLPGWVDVMKAKTIAYAAAANSQYVYLDKPIVVRVKDEFKETFVTHLVVKAYVLDTRYEFALASDITEAAKAEFLAQGLLRPTRRMLDHLDPTAAGDVWAADEGGP